MLMRPSNLHLAPSFALAVTLGLLAWLCSNVFIYHADVPFWDQWRFTEFLQKYYAKRLQFEDFWAQHNEHRTVFPRAIFLIVALLSDWNTLYEKLLSIALAAGILLCFFALGKRTIPAHSTWLVPWLTLVMASLIFSLRQFENWTWGWQLAIYLNVLCVCWATLLLTSRPLNMLRVVGALCLTVVASYSFANGLFFWGIGFLLLCFAKKPLQPRLTFLAIWSLGAFGTAASYLYGFERPAYHPDIFPFWSEPLTLLHYICTYLGSIFSGWLPGPNASNVQFATIIGGSGFGLFIAGSIAACGMRLKLDKLLPIIALALYAIGTGAAAGIGRLGISGVPHALSSRYTTTSLLFWCATAILLCYVLLELGQRRRWKMPAIVAFALLATVFVTATVASVTSQQRFINQFAKRSEAIRVLKSTDSPASHEERIKAVIWDPKLGRRYVEILKKHKLSLFR